MANAQSPLTKLGYSLVALPKTGIKPLLLLYKTINGVSSLDALLGELFQTVNVTIPQGLPEEATVDIRGAAELTYDAQGSIRMLDWLLSKLNLGKIAADVALSGNYEVAVSYTGVTEEKVSLLGLDSFISDADPRMAKFNSFGDKLRNNELFVINAVLKSPAMSVTISGKNGMDIHTDVAVKSILEANADIARKASNAITLDYKVDGKPVVFAFKAQQILYEKESFWSGRPARFKIREQTGVVLLGPEDIETRALMTGTVLVDI